MTVTYSRLFEVWRVLQQLAECRSAKLAYAVSRNLTILEKPLQSLQKSREAHVEGAEEWDLRKKEIIQCECLRDESGNPILRNGQNVFSDPVAVDRFINKTQKEEFPDLYAAEQERNQEYLDLLEEDSEVTDFPYVIKWSCIKVDDQGNMVDLTARQLAVLMGAGLFDGEPPWVEDDEEENVESSSKPEAAN